MSKSPPREFREIARGIAKDSIVAQATARLIEQIIEELHQSQIKPMHDRIEALESALKPFADVEPMHVYSEDDEDGNGSYILTENQFRNARTALNGGE